MTTDSLYETERLCNHIDGMSLDEINPKLQREFPSDISDKLFQYIQNGHCDQAVFYDIDKDYTLYNVYSYFKVIENDIRYNPSSQTVHLVPSLTAKTIDLYKPLRNHPELERLPKSHLITTHHDDGLQQDRQGNVFLRDSLNKHYHVNIDNILEQFDYWFTTNLSRKIHDNILPIPIGVCPGHRYTTQQIDDIRKSSIKNKLCNCRMSISSFDREAVALWANKTDWIDDFITPRQFQRQGVQTNEVGFALDFNARTNHKHIFTLWEKHDNYINELASYRYSICPQGNGIDTYRLYECITCNTVPIVQHNYANYIFSKIWPMILVHNYETEDIKQKIKDFENQNPCIDYDYSLLLRSNIDQLMERIKYECKCDNDKAWKIVL